jgi:hypothetical protein
MPLPQLAGTRRHPETFAKKPFYLTAENLCLGFGCREEKMKSDFAGSQLLSNFIIPLL